MNLDRLTAISGALALPALANDDGTATAEGEQLAARVGRTAEQFLVCGGHFTLGEWEALTPATREIVFRKAVELEQDRANLIAISIIRAQADPSLAFGRAQSVDPAPQSEGP